MKLHIPIIALLTCLMLTGSASANAPATVTTAFTPQCEELLLKQINEARQEIKVAIFTFSKRAIADALIDRAQHNVKVFVKIDARESEFEYTQELLRRLEQAKVKVESIKLPAQVKMHHKFAVIDGKCVATGSFNWTKRATEENFENLVVIASPAIAQRYLVEWDRIKSAP